ncbi:MAG: ABC transporter ATP-binding protein [Xanthobacteraceae bacterium]|nr:ABC transporter ATP-binding protein [Xanthobacteraceae bacterium]QYK46305.1 MAG: ABC transporter ATP-binding protein [Xanthobacteraceae bacterium]
MAQSVASRSPAPVSIAAHIAFDDVHHAYDGKESVRGVTLAVEPAEVISLVGPSGCGKTTLLRLAAGLEQPSAGRVLLDGKEIAGPSVFLPPEKRGIGLMFQDYALFPHMTNAENVRFGLRGFTRAESERQAQVALERVGLGDRGAQYPHMLSGGEQQRVALARAIAPRPAVILMDEPFSGLDSRLRDAVRTETLAILREARATCLIVTHDPEEAMRMGDRIALMNRGRVVESGDPQLIYRQPGSLFAARFFCEMNEIAGMVKDGRADTPLGNFAASGLAAGEAVVCIRPQGIRLGTAAQGVPGRVISRRFVGEVDILEIAVAGLEQPLTVRSRDTGSRGEEDDVRVEIDPSEVLVFAPSRA